MWGAVGAHDAGVESHTPTNVHKVQKNGIKSQGQRGMAFCYIRIRGRVGGMERWREGSYSVVERALVCQILRHVCSLQATVPVSH